MTEPLKPMTTPLMTVTYPDLRAGAMWRRTVRHAVRVAKILGADVHVAEQWRLLDSKFTIRAVGTEDALAPLMKLAVLAQAHRTGKEDC